MTQRENLPEEDAINQEIAATSAEPPVGSGTSDSSTLGSSPPPTASKKSVIVDLVILAVVFWGVWSLRFVGVGNIGLWSMLAGVSVGLGLLKMRGQSLASIGLVPWAQGRVNLRSKTLGALLVIALATVGGALVFITLLGPMDSGTAIIEQPATIGLFLLDILVGVWVGAALGEEIFFRGLLLSKFRTLFSGGNFSAKWVAILAVVAQAVWFGAGHASQGITGIAVTGFIGLCLGFYYLYRSPGNLWPMIIAHGLANTLSLTLNFVQSG